MASDALDGLKALLSQIPLTAEQAKHAEELVKQCTGDELAVLGLGPPTRPIVPKTLDKLPPVQRVEAIQRIICSLGYNHMPGYCYNVSKDRPLCRIMDTAREVLREALPIKCIEAVFLGVLLTSAWDEYARLPVGFKSRCAGNTYRHIVLAVRHTPSGQWGALGISRRQEDLGGKPLAFSSLADLMASYKEGYEKWGHRLQKVRVGLPVEHATSDRGPVCWRYCNVSAGRHEWGICRDVLDRFEAAADGLAARFKVLGGIKPPSRGRGYGGRPGGTGPTGPSATGTTPDPPTYASPARPARAPRDTEDGAEAGGDSASERGSAAQVAPRLPPRPSAAASPSPARKRAAATPQRPTRHHGSTGAGQEGSITPSRSTRSSTPSKTSVATPSGKHWTRRAPSNKPPVQRSASCPRPRGRPPAPGANHQAAPLLTPDPGHAPGPAAVMPGGDAPGGNASSSSAGGQMGTHSGEGGHAPALVLPQLPGSGGHTPTAQPGSRAGTPGRPGSGLGVGAGTKTPSRLASAANDQQQQQQQLGLPPLLSRSHAQRDGPSHMSDPRSYSSGIREPDEWDDAVAVTLAGHTSESESDIDEGSESGSEDREG